MGGVLQAGDGVLAGGVKMLFCAIRHVMLDKWMPIVFNRQYRYHSFFAACCETVFGRYVPGERIPVKSDKMATKTGKLCIIYKMSALVLCKAYHFAKNQ